MTTELNNEVWTSEELMIEFQYLLEERLALMVGAGEPSPEQLAAAVVEADEACEKLRKDRSETAT